jgi:hypothetical protein
MNERVEIKKKSVGDRLDPTSIKNNPLFSLTSYL